jgi:hypothetical protein
LPPPANERQEGEARAECDQSCGFGNGVEDSGDHVRRNEIAEFTGWRFQKAAGVEEGRDWLVLDVILARVLVELVPADDELGRVIVLSNASSAWPPRGNARALVNDPCGSIDAGNGDRAF